jgi:hypothetical protein
MTIQREISIRPVCCRVCGAPFVPHLVWHGLPATEAGLCEDHYPIAILMFQSLDDKRARVHNPDNPAGATTLPLGSPASPA